MRINLISAVGMKGAVVLGLLAFGSGVCRAQKPELVVQTGHSEDVHSAAFSADGKLLVSGGSDNTIKVWEVATGRQLRTINAPGSLRSSDDGKTLAIVAGRTIRMLELDTGQLRPPVGLSHSVQWVALSPDGHRLASSGQDKIIRVWEVATGRELITVTWDSPNVVNSVTFSLMGRH